MEAVLRAAMSCLGVHYKWGGANPVDGLDCSGFVQWVLRAAGIDPPGDQTAQALYNHFERLHGATGAAGLGSLAFYGKSVTQISHVAFCLNGFQMIEAGGGDHTTLTPRDAAAKDACVRIRMIRARADLVAIVKPSYATIGVIA